MLMLLMGQHLKLCLKQGVAFEYLMKVSKVVKCLFGQGPLACIGRGYL
jgi:hypothetical protein